MGDSGSAVNYFEESVNFLTKVATDDLEVYLLPFYGILAFINFLKKSG